MASGESSFEGQCAAQYNTRGGAGRGARARGRGPGPGPGRRRATRRERVCETRSDGGTISFEPMHRTFIALTRLIQYPVSVSDLYLYTRKTRKMRTPRRARATCCDLPGTYFVLA